MTFSSHVIITIIIVFIIDNNDNPIKENLIPHDT